MLSRLDLNNNCALPLLTLPVMKKHLVLFALVLVGGFWGAHRLLAQTNTKCGVMVMAHGGTDEWNAAIETAVLPLRDLLPTAIAFGMADPATLKQAMAALEEQEVNCIVVVRLFMSAHSFRHQTEYLLGLRADPPPFFISHGEQGSHPGSDAEVPQPLSVKADILLNREGLLDAPQMGDVLAERALSMSDKSGRESILIIAHGPGDDAENDEWLRKLDRLADTIRAAGSFTAVEVHTLREDWQEKRAEAENSIRAFVEAKSKDNGRVLVIPFRLYGFGPYEKVLDGLSYEANGTGLLPSPQVTDWIREQAQKTLQASGWSVDALQ
jgi:sirohydrochlorin cobaltochelatase